MVVAADTKAWLSRMRVRSLGLHAGDRALPPGGTGAGGADPRHLGILAFEAGRTMSRLVSLHRGLSESEVARLRCDVMRSQGVAYLNSADQVALLRLACAEMADDLDAAAAAVARLAGRCREGWPRGFDHVYKELKEGTCAAGDISRLGLGLHARDVEKKVRKMEKYASSTAALYVAMEGLAGLEAGERRLAKWRQWGGVVSPAEVEALQRQISLQRDRVRQLREDSLWCRSFDKVVELMARSVISIFARICSVFGAAVAELPQVVHGRHGRLELTPRLAQLPGRLFHYPANINNRSAGISMSGPLERPPVGNVLIRNSGPILRSSPAVIGDDEGAGASAAPQHAGGHRGGARGVQLMVQTLMFSDREKAEAAIVEVLVAFSCVCRYRQVEEEEDGRGDDF